MNTIHLGLGSNLGDRLDNLRRAVAALAPEVAVQKVSSVYESEPMYLSEQPSFLNIALSATTELTPMDLLNKLKTIEREMGRCTEAPRNAPREIDLDILFFDDIVFDTPELSIPHPRLHERAFVLVPLDEIAPLTIHPVTRMPVADLHDQLGVTDDIVWPVDGAL